MRCIGSPRWGEGRCESEAVGPAPSDILGGGSQFGAQEGPEALKVGSSSVQSALADVPAVFSLLAEDGPEEVSDEVHPRSDSAGDSPVESGGGCDQSQAAAAVLRDLNAVGGVRFQFSDLPTSIRAHGLKSTAPSADDYPRTQPIPQPLAHPADLVPLGTSY
eukprot:COSAG05_NODE_936_length_6533_cov_5.310227_3_plen_162_part_00